FFFQAEDGIRDLIVTGVQTCALPICSLPLPERETVRFKARFDLTPVAGRLIYVPHDYAVQFRPKSTAEFRHRSGDLGRYTLGVRSEERRVGKECRFRWWG